MLTGRSVSPAPRSDCSPSRASQPHIERHRRTATHTATGATCTETNQPCTRSVPAPPVRPTPRAHTHVASPAPRRPQWRAVVRRRRRAAVRQAVRRRPPAVQPAGARVTVRPRAPPCSGWTPTAPECPRRASGCRPPVEKRARSGQSTNSHTITADRRERARSGQSSHSTGKNRRPARTRHDI